MITEKQCSCCGEIKPITAFHKHKRDGYQSHCSSCQKARKRKKYAEDEKFRRSEQAKSRKRAELNRPRVYENNAKRRADRMTATPNWLSREQRNEIKDLFIAADAFQLYTGEEYHVDHIIPLRHEAVSGLHVPWNLQILPHKENLNKSNKLILPFDQSW